MADILFTKEMFSTAYYRQELTINSTVQFQDRLQEASCLTCLGYGCRYRLACKMVTKPKTRPAPSCIKIKDKIEDYYLFFCSSSCAELWLLRNW